MITIAIITRLLDWSGGMFLNCSILLWFSTTYGQLYGWPLVDIIYKAKNLE